MTTKADESTINETEIQVVIDQPMGGKKNIVLDATMLSTIMGCGRLTDFRFNHNLQSLNGKSNSLEVGNIVHKYLETYYRNVINGFPKSESHASGLVAAETYARGCPQCVARTCEKHPTFEYQGVRNTPYEPSKPYEVGWKWVLETCEQYHQYYRNDYWVPLEVEKVKGEVLYEDDEIRILWKAKFDLTADSNQGIYPIDHKTMKQRRDTLSLNNQFIGQCILQRSRAVIINKIGFQKTLKPEEKFERAMVSYSAKRLIEWQSTILPYWAYKLIDFTENDYWPPNFDHCDNKYGTCAFKEVCEADPDDREREIKLNFIVGEPWYPTSSEDE